MGKFGLNLLALILVFGPSNALAQRGNIVNYRCVGLVNDVGFDLSGEISLVDCQTLPFGTDNSFGAGSCFPWLYNGAVRLGTSGPISVFTSLHFSARPQEMIAVNHAGSKVVSAGATDVATYASAPNARFNAALSPGGSVTISSGVPSFAPNARYVECNFTPSLQREL